MEFDIKSSFSPKGDQRRAIASLVEGLEKGMRYQTLKGITGSGKTYTMAQVVEQVQRPTLVLSHNKTLAAQLYREFRNFFPDNAVEYFVSYYDYYQPEAYVPSRDLYIAKDASINAEIDRLRHSATSTLLTRSDVLIVSTVSAIYGLGRPDLYKSMSVTFTKGQKVSPKEVMSQLVAMQYTRNDAVLKRACFRSQGDTLLVWPSYGEQVYKMRWDFEELESISLHDPLTLTKLQELESVVLFPAKHFVIPQQELNIAIDAIEQELKSHYQTLLNEGKLVEAQRVKMRTEDDLVMLAEFGSCPGVENYSRYLTFREAGQRPYTLLDYFPSHALFFLDESHVLLGQLRAMYLGDKRRKDNLVQYGFRLPSAYDNRPLTYEEFETFLAQAVYVSATPANTELENSQQIVLQEIRPTGLLDPVVELRGTHGQMEDLYAAIQQRKAQGQVCLVTTLTKKMAESLSRYLADLGLNVEYLHAEVELFDRAELIGKLRRKQLDVIVGINLLREGLDIPEVSLVAILDADKIGFLRSKTSLIQTMGRAARHQEGTVILYADTITSAMQEAIEETQQRRHKQMAYNALHHITPQSVYKPLQELLEKEAEADTLPEPVEELQQDFNRLEPQQRKKVLASLTKQMLTSSKNLEFEKAALLRDKILQLRNSS